MKILLAADGSEFTRKAVRALVKQAAEYRQAPEIFVHHVIPPIPYPGAAKVAGKKAIDDFQREEAEAALKVAADELKGSKVAFTPSWSVGQVAEEIAAAVRKNKADLVVVGCRGHGALAGMALGSVTMKLLASCPVPIMVVR